ncbi:probable G-protein coupled receptor 52 [Acanthaster planci]|uniref:Probable G-protein coupled receptor 52 n=1 Tax=Acanthaster planci TaxID=133434 RepID=A0A8B7XVE6_ACAPL|nr:probable G-protein coupled receptor 52 [Acanthaster planci]XP_022084223.1 probable G-protein coupled receptor 52 [Acanthaster planci]
MEGTALTEAMLNATTEPLDSIPAGWYPEVARVLLVTTSFLTIVANLLVLVVFQYMKALENMTGVFVKSLAVADLGVGVCVFAAIESNWANNLPYGMWSCKLMAYFMATMVGGSILSLTCVSIDRYIAVIKPLKYRSIVTKRRARIYAVAVWIFVALLFLPAMFGWGGYIFEEYSDDCKQHFNQSLSISFYIICVLILPAILTSAFCYFHIWRACLAQTRQIERLGSLFHEGEPQQDTSSRLYEKMLAKIFLVVISAFYLSWIPFVVQKAVELATDVEFHPAVNFCTAWLGFLNSFFNCIIYIICHRSFREGLHLLLKAIWRRVTSLCKISKDRCFAQSRERSQSQVMQLREFSMTDC